MLAVDMCVDLVLSSLSDLNAVSQGGQSNKLMHAQQKISEVSRMLAALPQNAIEPAILSNQAVRQQQPGAGLNNKNG